jgi:hypothetical protein
MINHSVVTGQYIVDNRRSGPKLPHTYSENACQSAAQRGPRNRGASNVSLQASSISLTFESQLRCVAHNVNRIHPIPIPITSTYTGYNLINQSKSPSPTKPARLFACENCYNHRSNQLCNKYCPRASRSIRSLAGPSFPYRYLQPWAPSRRP